MLRLILASSTKLPGHTSVNSISFVTRWPLFSTSSRRTSNTFGVSGTRWPSRSSTCSDRSSWKGPNRYDGSALRVIGPRGSALRRFLDLFWRFLQGRARPSASIYTLRRQVMQKRFATAIFTLVAALAASVLSSREARPQTGSCFVATSSGAVQGVDNGSSCAFLGIPFAAPPLGNLRWKPPQPAAPWAPTLNANVAPGPCPVVNPPGSNVTAGSENCLKLNIWTPDPAPASPAPVIVWIPTGAFQAASASIADSNGRNFAERTGAIVVAANYRLGPFGFLGHPA